LKFYEITIRPISGFGTPLKGDTLFGHFCWQVAYEPDLVEGGLERALESYGERPFAVFSSAFVRLESGNVRYLLPRPCLPVSCFLEKGMTRRARYEAVKDLKSRKWLSVREGLKLDLGGESLADVTGTLLEKTPNSKTPEAREGHEGIVGMFVQAHNSINRLTQTTSGPEFAPYATDVHYYHPALELAFFVLVDEGMTDIERVKRGMENIGRFGYGRDASTGLGRFDVCDVAELKLERPEGVNACYTLAPCVPEKGAYREIHYSPFVRFGKHGDRLATAANPFKNPVVMADEGAVLIPKKAEALNKSFVGQAVSGISKAEPGTVVQGYAPYIPLRMESCDG